MAYSADKSAFASTEKCSGYIYGIYDNRKKKNAEKLAVTDCVYVGKSTQKVKGSRFVQHAGQDKNYPWKDKSLEWNEDSYETWPFVPRTIEDIKGWTRFDIAVAEQYHMTNAVELGGNILNKINALSKEKWDDYKDTKSYTIKNQMNGWEYVSLKHTQDSDDGNSGFDW